MEGISLDFHCFTALNNNLEARLFLHVHFYASSDLLMPCRTMQLRFLKLGIVLTYAFNIRFDKIIPTNYPAVDQIYIILEGLVEEMSVILL